MRELLTLTVLPLMLVAFSVVVWVSFIKPNPKLVAQMPGGLARLRLANSTFFIAFLWPQVVAVVLVLFGVDLPEYATFFGIGLGLLSSLALKRWSLMGSLWKDLDNAHYEVGRLQRLHAYNSRR